MIKTVSYNEYLVLRVIHEIRVISGNDDIAKIFIEK